MKNREAPAPTEIASLVGLAGDTLQGSFPSPDIAVAEVAGVADGFLHWQPRMVALRRERELCGFLYQFVQVADASDADIERTAKEYGPLGLCERHGLPMCHRGQGALAPTLQDTDDLGTVCPPIKVAQGYLEAVEKWRDYAKLAAAILRLAAEVRRGEPGDADAWRVVAGIDHAPGPDELPLVKLAGAFTLWQWAADLRPMVAAADTGGQLRLWLVSADAAPLPDEYGQMKPSMGHRGGLFAVLTTHLMLATAGGPGLSWCSACGTLFRPLRTPTRGKRSFCNECRETNARQRLHMRDVRSKPR
jgi:hypothetical protein